MLLLTKYIKVKCFVARINATKKQHGGISKNMNLAEMMQKISNLNLSKYEIINKEELNDIHSVGLLLRHKKSQARVVVIVNDDNNKVFSIGFKTPPYNDTGLQHIIEHSTLCGSRKYPVKDPFVELCKGSLNTFLNAMTFPDKTVYPVASCNDADFRNIMDVYMDAVFYPDIYNNPNIFKQEGWHYELEDEREDIFYNGVVYNEMKGVYSSPDDILSRYTFTSLFPNTAYRFESGGDPECIPQLTYEEFLDYHKKYYHPANSYIYMYGDMDIQERLDYLDREYLSQFEAQTVHVDSNIQLQEPFCAMADLSKPFPVTEDELLNDNTYLSFNKVVGTATDAKLYLAMQILDYALIVAPGAKLKQALVDKGVGDDIYSSLETSVYQPIYSIIAKNSESDKKQLFLNTIYEVLTDIVENGIDKRMIAAGINYYEFKYREADYGPYPKGLMYYLTMMDSWLYDEEKPFIHVKASAIFEQLKKEKDEGLFEKLIQNYLLDNNHGSVITLYPKRGLEEEKNQKLEEQLRAYKDTLTDKEIEQLVRDTKELKEYQDEPSSQEALQSIPMLTLEDIGREPAPLYIDKRQISGIDVIHHNMFTNKIGYIMMAFNCKEIPDELIPYMGLLTSTIGLMDTQNFTFPELSNEININSGGVSSDVSIYGDKENPNKYTIMYEVKGKALYEKIPFVLDIMYEMIYRTKFNDYKRLKEIIARVKSRLETSMTNSGHTVALISGMAQFSEKGYYSDKIRGYGYYELIEKLNRDFDDCKEQIVANLKECVKLIFHKENLIVSFTADDDGFSHLVKPMEQFEKGLKKLRRPSAQRLYKPCKVKKAFTFSSQVNYVARCGNFVNAGYMYTGALKVLKVIFSYDYLWINIRVKGGAYGCMSAFARSGDMYMVSYRDPNIRKTNEIYEDAADYIKKFNASDRDMLKFIIGTIGDMDAPMNPSSKGIRSFSAYISNYTIEDFKKEREEVLTANAEVIRKLAPLIRAGISQDYLCVVGNQKAIHDESELFDSITPLFK